MAAPLTPFEEHADRYDEWFEVHETAHESELNAVESVLPEFDPREAVEIGVGSGRFAAPLGIGIGVDPSPAMLVRARDRGVEAILGVAEALPLRNDAASVALIVTTICFVDDVDRTLREAARVLEPGGTLAIGFVDRDSPLGRHYREVKDENPFYRDATFLSVPEVLDGLAGAGFEDPTTVQTLFSDPLDLEAPDRVEVGWGEGSFVVVAARTPRTRE